MSLSAVAVATRLEARSWRAAVAVLRRTDEVLSACAAVEGFSGARLRVDRRHVLWTVSVWSDRSALRRFGARHAAVAATVDAVARSTSSVTWEVPHELPSWCEVAARMPDQLPPAIGLDRVVSGAPGLLLTR